MGATQIWAQKKGMQTGHFIHNNKVIKRCIYSIVEIFLNYARASDTTMLVALGSIYFSQSKSNEITAKSNKKLVDCCSPHPDSTIWYKESESQAHSPAWGHFFSGSQIFDSSDNNGDIINISENIKIS